MFKKMSAYVVFSLLMSFFSYSALAEYTVVDKAAIKRIQPIGQVSVAEAPVDSEPMETTEDDDSTKAEPDTESQGASDHAEGKKIYDKSCKTCHAAGIAGAPKLGDSAAWQTRIDQGLPVLIEHVTEGFKAMPPKGACPECTEADIKAAIEYMISESGAKSANN